jgi:hypothetical protein
MLTKNQFSVIAFLTLSITLGSCSHKVVVNGPVYHPEHKKNSLPPGQAKKVNGDQSAKAYAPGQVKKQH